MVTRIISRIVYYMNNWHIGNQMISEELIFLDLIVYFIIKLLPNNALTDNFK